MLNDSLTCDGSDFIEIWRLVVEARNGLKIGQKYSVLTRNLKKQPSKRYYSVTAWPFYLKICTMVIKASKSLVGAEFWNFDFCTIFSPNTFKKWRFSPFLKLSGAKKGKIQEYGLIIFFHSRYLCANFRVKWSRNENGVAILRLIF